jgi:hypothetical protein
MTGADNVTTLAAQVSVFLATAREQCKDGVSWTEFGQMLVQLLHLLVTGLDTISTLTGPEKKAIVLTAVGTLFDTFADRCVPLAVYPAWIILRPGTRVLIICIAAGATEALLQITRSST